MPKNPIAKNINKFNKPKVIPDKRRKQLDEEYESDSLQELMQDHLEYLLKD